ncbi:MAG TPA: YegP family protein [Thermoanaerobaculia bacterium]|jgi:hypothetical protein
MPGKYELKKTASGQYMFNLKAANHQVILTSEQYRAKDSAFVGIAAVRKNSPLDERYHRKVASDGQHYFVLWAANNKVIGKSELYKTKAAMENGVASVKKNGPTAPIDNQIPPPRS